MTTTSGEHKNITVLGAGVIGLTTALRFQERGFQVTILAEHFPTDPKTVGYTSSWAGAHHVSVAGNDVLQRNIDIETFKTMWNLSETAGGETGECFLRLPQLEFYREERTHDTLNLMPNFTELPRSSLVPHSVSGITYDSVNTDVPVFLPYLLSRFLGHGGKIIRGSVQHINQVIDGGPGAFDDLEKDEIRKHLIPDGVVLCVGLGARFLGGIEDGDVYPVRGQVLRIRAPWLTKCMSLSGGPSNVWTYIIPRRSGDAIVGGTYEVNDWHPLPRSETTTDILERALELCPEIAPPEIRAERQPTIDDIRPLIIEEGCGFRPCRKGGVRLEYERIQGSLRKIPVVHNYGHGGFGYIACFGSASVACNLMTTALEGS